MLSFWGRISNKSPGRTSNLPSQLSQQTEDVELPRTPPRTLHLPHVPAPEDHTPMIPMKVTPEPVVAVPNHHDAAVAEVHAKLLQAEQQASTGHPPRFTDPLTDAATPPNPPPEKFYDPATGVLRGVFEPAATDGSGDCEQLRDEAWTHLARIREIQSEIATMHMHMESVGDEPGSVEVEVDNDIDVDTVPTQEEEDAAKTAKEFDKLPDRFKGRSDHIDAMMAKLDELSQAVTSFHALQPPPLSFDSAATSRQTTHSDTTSPTGDHAGPTTVRTRPMFGPKVILDKNTLHDSPITARAPFPLDISPKS